MMKASGDSITVVFENLKPGKYAVSVLHDANKNKDLDKNKLGIPKEGFGFSNNVMGRWAHHHLKELNSICRLNRKIWTLISK